MVSNNNLLLTLGFGCGYSEETIDLPFVYWPRPDGYYNTAVCTSRCPDNSTDAISCRTISKFDGDSNWNAETCRYSSSVEYGTDFDTVPCKKKYLNLK